MGNEKLKIKMKNQKVNTSAFPLLFNLSFFISHSSFFPKGCFDKKKEAFVRKPPLAILRLYSNRIFFPY